MKKNEIEIKLQLNKEEFYGLVSKRTKFQLEITYGFFKPDFSNISAGIFPRIKFKPNHPKPITLTVKQKKSANKTYFEREETEIQITPANSVDYLRDIIKLLGYSTEIVFEKKRYEEQSANLVISYDILPFGYFIELEGEPADIEQQLLKWRLEKKERVVESYLAVWDKYREKHQIKNQDCVFGENVSQY